MYGLLVQDRLDKDVAREEILDARLLLAVLDLKDLLGGDEDVGDLLLEIRLRDLGLQIRLHLRFMSGIGPDDIPPFRHRVVP